MKYDKVYSDEELKIVLKKMQEASRVLYVNARDTGCHPFIEFCGILNEWIQMCETTMKKNLDYTQSNRHTGQPLEAEPFQIKYFAEKFECIFGPLLSKEENKKIFFKEMGW